MSQSQIVWSHPQLAMSRPSGLQATANTRSVCPASVSRTRRLSTSHSLTVRSQLPLARVLLSGAKASPVTPVVCSVSLCTQGVGWVFCLSHPRICPSKLPLASRLPSGLQASAYTGPLWPERVWRCVPDVASQSRTVASFPPLASVHPSGAKVRLWMLVVCQLVQSKAPLSMSHSVMAPFQLPVARVRPSGLKARAASVSVCACQARCRSLPPCRHTRAFPHLLPAAQ